MQKPPQLDELTRLGMDTKMATDLIEMVSAGLVEWRYKDGVPCFRITEAGYDAAI